MDNADLTLKLWQDLSERVDNITSGKNYLTRMKHQEMEKEYVGDEVVRLQEGETYQRALELLTTEIECMILLIPYIVLKIRTLILIS